MDPIALRLLAYYVKIPCLFQEAFRFYRTLIISGDNLKIIYWLLRPYDKHVFNVAGWYSTNFSSIIFSYNLLSTLS